MFSKFYNTHIAQGKSFLIFAAIAAAFLRGYHFLHTEMVIPPAEISGWLWQPLAFLFQDPLYNLIGSTVFTLIIALQVNLLNTKHALIRKKTMLPVGIVLLLFSFLPLQLVMSSAYIGVVVLLIGINNVFSAHEQATNQMIVFKASLYLAFGSLFDPILLIYFPILWICFIRIRSFGFRAFLASLLSIILLYAPVFSYYLLIDGNIDEFTNPLSQAVISGQTFIPLFGYDTIRYVTLGMVALMIIGILLDNSLNGFKNKIRIRVFLAVLSIISIFSVLCVVLLHTDSVLPLYVAFATGSLLIGHFFSLTSSKPLSFVFYILLIFLFAISFLL